MELFTNIAGKTGKRIMNRLTSEKTVLFVCDVQERFRPLIYRAETTINRTVLMHSASKLLGIPCLATEQYPKAFGPTVPDLQLDKPAFTKTKFSMMTPEVKCAFDEIKRPQVLMCGIEAHVCVLQTVLDLLEAGVDVHVVCDAVSSQR